MSLRSSPAIETPAISHQDGIAHAAVSLGVRVAVHAMTDAPASKGIKVARIDTIKAVPDMARGQAIPCRGMMRDHDHLPAFRRTMAGSKGHDRWVKRREGVPRLKLAKYLFVFCVNVPFPGDEEVTDMASRSSHAGSASSLASLQRVVPRKCRQSPRARCSDRGCRGRAGRP